MSYNGLVLIDLPSLTTTNALAGKLSNDGVWQERTFDSRAIAVKQQFVVEQQQSGDVIYNVKYTTDTTAVLPNPDPIPPTPVPDPNPTPPSGGGGGSFTPSTTTMALIDNVFLINRMAFLNDQQLSERFRLLKNDDGAYSKGGWWMQDNYVNADFNTKLGNHLNTMVNFNSFKAGVDGVRESTYFDFMNGFFVGTSLMSAKYERKLGDSKITDTSVGVYSALAFYSGTYVEFDLGWDFYKSKVNVMVQGLNAKNGQIAHTNYDSEAFSASAAVGQRFEFGNELLIDANIKVDYTAFQAANFLSDNGLKGKAEGYSNYGFIGSALFGKYVNDRKGLVYFKTDIGQYINDMGDHTFIEEVDTGKKYQFKNPNYNLFYGNFIAGFKARMTEKLEVSLEVSHYIMSGRSDLDIGGRGEIRYFF